VVALLYNKAKVKEKNYGRSCGGASVPAATHTTRCWSTKCLVFATPDTRRTTFTIIAAAIYKSEMFQGLSSCSERKP